MTRSSTYKHMPIDPLTKETKSLIATANSETLNEESCGTKFSKVLAEEIVVPTCTYICDSLKKDEIKRGRFSQNPQPYSFLNILYRHINMGFF